MRGVECGSETLITFLGGRCRMPEWPARDPTSGTLHPFPTAVLGRFLHSLNQFCLEEHGLRYQVSDYFLYDFAKVWKCSQEASNVMVHNFFKSHHFSAGIQPIPGALFWGDCMVEGRSGGGGWRQACVVVLPWTWGRDPRAVHGWDVEDVNGASDGAPGPRPLTLCAQVRWRS